MSSALGELTVTMMHGTHNAFAVFDARSARGPEYAGLARRLCAPAANFGIDGLLVIEAAEHAAARMRIFNADGGEAEMCGNGIRCVARYVFERGETPEHFVIETVAGAVGCDIVATTPEFCVRVDIGTVRFPGDARDETLDVGGETGTRAVTYVAVDAGNPHVVLFRDDVARVDLATLGAAVARHAHFPAGTNVHVAQVLDAHTLRVRHYERGVGLTQACGTGAVACAAAGIARGLVASPVAVDVPGGRLTVEWKPGESAFLTGAAQREQVRTFLP